MQKGLNYLLQKYSVNSEVTLSECGKATVIDGKSYPVLPWESERRFVELRKLVDSGRLGQLCTYRIAHNSKVGTDIYELLYRELGILVYTVNSKVKEIFAIAGKNTINCIAETENGCVATLEIAATLTEGQKDIDKHEIIADSGVACDRVVDTQVPQESIYVFGKNQATYLDTDAELFGYRECEVNIIRNAFALAKCEELRAENEATASHLNDVLAAAKRSLDALENVTV